LANAREVLARLERYELEVFAGEETAGIAEPADSHAIAQAASQSAFTTHQAGDAIDRATRRAGRRKAAAQASLFDLANQKVVEELLRLNPDSLSADEAKELLCKLHNRLM